MERSSSLRSAVIGSVRDTRGRIRIWARRTIWFAALTLVNLSAHAVAKPSCTGIDVKILGIKNSTGTVACALFESPVGFPNDYLHYAINITVVKIREMQARCEFPGTPPGAYALAVVHDENMNGKHDTNWLGLPAEGYGFSNDAIALFDEPLFSDAGFQYDGQNLELTINLRY